MRYSASIKQAARGLIENVFDCLKNFCNIERSHHRSVKNFFINLWTGLPAYTFMEGLPSIPTDFHKLNLVKKDHLIFIKY
jgi:hypothetical protein